MKSENLFIVSFCLTLLFLLLFLAPNHQIIYKINKKC